MTHTSTEQHDSIDAFIQMATADGFDVAHNFYDGKGWVFFNPATADIWKYWKAAQAQRAPLTRKQINECSRDAQIAFCLDKQPTYEVALTREVERRHGITQEKQG